jgi:glycolate oxidase FAD binding subunit
MRTESPSSQRDAAALLADATAGGDVVRPVGGGTKKGWGYPIAADVELSTAELDRTIEHNEGDLTSVLEAGVPLRRAQEEFGRARQFLALDPPLGEQAEATIGGVVATGDSGPLRHRYGAVRDLVVGITVALSDGTVAKAGGKVIKNVAGYDLAKLYSGSFGTLGVILEVAVRLHPKPPRTATARAFSEDPAALGRVVDALAHLPLEAECLDLVWREGAGAVLARFGGATPEERASNAHGAMKRAGVEADLVEDDDQMWAHQRELQRALGGVSVRISGVVQDAGRIVEVARALGASVVGRAGLGLFYMTYDDGDAADPASSIEDIRARLAPRPCVVLDAPEDVRRKVDVWDHGDGSDLTLMRRVKERFDPSAVLNRGLFVGGL